jgi:hypothetical protein
LISTSPSFTVTPLDPLASRGDTPRHECPLGAAEAAKLAARRQRIGRSVDFRDTQIAGIALARRADVATGNVRHFEGLGLSIINPWEP